jgi:hypothetical protein
VQEAHNTAGTEGESSFRRGRSWFATAALVVVAAVGVIAATIIFTMDSDAPDAPPTRSDSNTGAPTMTDQEAIDRYLELEDLAVRAYRTADLTLIPRIYTADSPTGDVVRKELRDLRRDSIRLFGSFQTESIEVLSNSSDEIVLRQEVIAKARLKPVGDVKVRARYHDLRQVVRIVLRYQEMSGWLIHDVIEIEAERLKS